MSASPHEFEALADQAVDEVITLYDALSEAIAARMDFEAERSVQKNNAILRIMEAKQIKATPAESLAESDPEYAAFLRAYRSSVANEMKAKGRAEAAVLRSQLAIARVQMLVGQEGVVSK